MLGWLSDDVVLVLDGNANRRDPALRLLESLKAARIPCRELGEQADVPDSVRSLETALDVAGTIGSRLFSYFHHLMGVRLAEPCLN